MSRLYVKMLIKVLCFFFLGIFRFLLFLYMVSVSNIGQLFDVGSILCVFHHKFAVHSISNQFQCNDIFIGCEHISNRGYLVQCLNDLDYCHLVGLQSKIVHEEFNFTVQNYGTFQSVGPYICSND